MKCLALFLLVLVNVAPAVGQEPQADRFWTAAQIRRATGTATVVSSDPRPLWMALNALEREYGWLIDYEDPLYQGSTETKPRHNAKWESLHPGVPSRAPAGTSFNSTYSEDSQTPHSTSQRQAILAQIVKDYNSSGNPGRFELRNGGQGRVNIVGYSKHDKPGQTAILGTLLTFPAGTTGSMEALQQLVDAVTEATGVRVVLGVVPWNLLVPAQVSPKPGPIPARVALTDIADSAKVQLMWDFLYDIDSQSYVLSLRPRSILLTNKEGRRILMPQ